jgi:hypothetical protein
LAKRDEIERRNPKQIQSRKSKWPKQQKGENMSKKHSPVVATLDSGVPIRRREAMRRGLLGAAGLLMADRLAAPAAAVPEPSKAKAKAVIQIWMWGGPAHLDTFDPKPEAGYDYCGPFEKPIPTNVDGIRICEMLPLLAQHADKYSIIRSMTHGNNGHETAAYLVQTGREPGGKLVYPSVGAVVSLFKGYDAGYDRLIPPYIVVTQPQGRFSEAGFLGSRYKPFATGGNPAAPQFVVEGVVSEGVTRQRQESRRGLLQKLDALDQAVEDDLLEASKKCESRAYDLILGDEGKVFDLSEEEEEVRLEYGRNEFGQSCLLARRLVERGFPYVTINSRGWDTHRGNFQAMRRKLPQVDAGMSTLLKELSERGLLESTIVWWSGEFGRTPKVDWQPPWDGGRHHHGNVFSAVVAGGGFKGGHVVGSSDAKGAEVKDRPVYPCDLIASMYELLGVDPDGTMPNPQGPPVRVTPAAADGVKSGGRLKEIT